MTVSRADYGKFRMAWERGFSLTLREGDYGTEPYDGGRKDFVDPSSRMKKARRSSRVISCLQDFWEAFLDLCGGAQVYQFAPPLRCLAVIQTSLHSAPESDGVLRQVEGASLSPEVEPIQNWLFAKAGRDVN
jgi:hypothetical protein